MEDVPQPANERYHIGDSVRIYVGEDDPDAEYHGVQGQITEVKEDSLAQETGRPLDSYSYRINPVTEDDGVWFRHFDLVPANEE